MPCLPAFRWWKRQPSGAPPCLPACLTDRPTCPPTPLPQVPSFLYAMPLGGNRVFLEETCLVARPPMPFATLKRRLERRCKALGIKVRELRERVEPWRGMLGLQQQCGAQCRNAGAWHQLLVDTCRWISAMNRRRPPAILSSL